MLPGLNKRVAIRLSVFVLHAFELFRRINCFLFYSTTKLIRSQSTTNDNEKQPNLNDNVNQLVAQAIAVWKKEYQLEIETLTAEVIEIKESQAFICNQYDSLKAEYDKLIEVNTLQKEEICDLTSQAAALKTKEIKDSIKVDELEQYGRRQNLEIVGVLEKENENTNAIVLEVAKMLDVDIMSSHIHIPSFTKEDGKQS